jgi:hypothetical protein
MVRAAIVLFLAVLIGAAIVVALLAGFLWLVGLASKRNRG